MSVVNKLHNITLKTAVWAQALKYKFF